MPPRLKRKDIEKRAEDILRRHKLYSIPIDPVVLANLEGIKVYNAKFSEDGLSGIISKRGKDVTMLVSQGDPPYRKRFTIAHELGHHYLHLEQDGEYIDNVVDLFRESDVENDNDPLGERFKEVEANQFAAALLMPEELVREAYKNQGTLARLSMVFNVSEEAMGIRLQRLNLV